VKFDDLIARGLCITLIGVDGAHLVSKSRCVTLVNYLAKHAPSCCWLAYESGRADGLGSVYWGDPIESGVLVGGESQTTT
jgi:hypothetical protein